MTIKEDVGIMPRETRLMVLQKIRQMTGQTNAKHKAANYRNEDGSFNIEKLTKNIILNYRLSQYRNQVTEFIKFVFENDKLIEETLFPKNETVPPKPESLKLRRLADDN